MPSDGRTFTITVTPNSEGYWSFFEVVKIEDISATSEFFTNEQSGSENEQLLQNHSIIDFPIEFPIGSTEVDINLARFGTVYSIKVGSVSEFGLKSPGLSVVYILTGMYLYEAILLIF